jgi:hypothetical protein
MKHIHFLIDISEHLGEMDWKEYHKIRRDFTKFLIEKGYYSFEKGLNEAIGEFLNIDIDLTDPSADSSSYKRVRRLPNYIAVVKRDMNYIYIDIEKLETICLEIDIFSPDDSTLKQIKEAIIEESMKHFGLTKSKSDIIKEIQSDEKLLDSIKGELEIIKPLSDSLFNRVKEKDDRDILRELKKRGSVLESDLKDLPLPGMKTERIKSTLDYFSGEEYQLVDRKFAVVCTQTKEILFLIKDKGDLEGSKLLCPKCSTEIGGETVLSYYESTEKLKQLLDGSRWMPLLIREALIKSNVPASNIFTEVKHGDDQIDVLVFYRGVVYVIEAKDRSVSLNDSYKLSAKTSHLENKFEELYQSRSQEGVVRIVRDNKIVVRRKRSNDFIPLIISTSDISKEARDLLQGTNKRALFLENCENGLDKFVSDVIGAADMEETGKAFNELVSSEAQDSISNFASSICFYGFLHWFKIMLEKS